MYDHYLASCKLAGALAVQLHDIEGEVVVDLFANIFNFAEPLIC